MGGGVGVGVGGAGEDASHHHPPITVDKTVSWVCAVLMLHATTFSINVVLIPLHGVTICQEGKHQFIWSAFSKGVANLNIYIYIYGFSIFNWIKTYQGHFRL